jgi:hypothetical protein
LPRRPQLELIMSMDPVYITDASLAHGDRIDDDALKTHIRNKWQVLESPSEMTSHMCGNLRVVFQNSQAELTDELKHTPAWRQISSALALYRTISLFECGLCTTFADFYKINWAVTLLHTPTNIKVTLSEWKGAFQIFTPFSSMKNVDPGYKEDVEELVTLLVSPTMTIGYDGTIAGTVA